MIRIELKPTHIEKTYSGSTYVPDLVSEIFTDNGSLPFFITKVDDIDSLTHYRITFGYKTKDYKQIHGKLKRILLNRILEEIKKEKIIL